MILTRYLFKEFIQPFFFSTFIFALIIQAGHLFDRLEVFMRNKVTIPVIVLYLLSMLPLWIIQALPICTLIAGVITVGNLSRSGELFCLRASGVSARVVMRPLFGAALFLTCLTFVLGDSLMPRATAYGRTLYRTYVDKIGNQKPVWDDIIVLAKNRRRISAKRLDVEKGEMTVVTVEEYGDHLNLRQALTAQKAEWHKDHGWTFYDGVVRLFSKEGDEIVEEESFVSAQITMEERPEDLVPTLIQPEELSAQDLKRYIEKIKGLGLPALKERVQYHLKFAFPFTHLLVLAIGLPIAFKTTPSGGGHGQKSFGRMRSLAFSLLIGFFYLMLVTAGQALGESRKVEPWVGVWMANILFLVVGLFLLRRVE